MTDQDETVLLENQKSQRPTYREQSQSIMSELTRGIPASQAEFLRKLSSFPKHNPLSNESANTHRSDPDSRQPLQFMERRRNQQALQR